MDLEVTPLNISSFRYDKLDESVDEKECRTGHSTLYSAILAGSNMKPETSG
jgi:hypothetical protein